MGNRGVLITIWHLSLKVEPLSKMQRPMPGIDFMIDLSANAGHRKQQQIKRTETN